MANYKVIVTAREWAQLQIFEKPNGSTFNTGEKNVSFIVDARYPDRVTMSEFLKSTGLKIRKGYPSPFELRNANGWSLRVM